ncbi:hypothetical protein [Burkholderia sp. ABCPW 11]|uniref:hypothetical protein n=1 Tax=Burkholderia sp. ABCPW 11 TaxID=1637859 RepID=UPI0012FDF819|nr:hypothetical protein [Burkholderia sp. ABCPW 11]
MRTDTLNQGQRLPTSIGKYDAPLARSVARAATTNDGTTERLRLPSTLVPVLP